MQNKYLDIKERRLLFFQSAPDKGAEGGIESTEKKPEKSVEDQKQEVYDNIYSSLKSINNLRSKMNEAKDNQEDSWAGNRRSKKLEAFINGEETTNLINDTQNIKDKDGISVDELSKIGERIEKKINEGNALLNDPLIWAWEDDKAKNEAPEPVPEIKQTTPTEDKITYFGQDDGGESKQKAEENLKADPSFLINESDGGRGEKLAKESKAADPLVLAWGDNGENTQPLAKKTSDNIQNNEELITQDQVKEVETAAPNSSPQILDQGDPTVKEEDEKNKAKVKDSQTQEDSTEASETQETKNEEDSDQEPNKKIPTTVDEMADGVTVSDDDYNAINESALSEEELAIKNALKTPNILGKSQGKAVEANSTQTPKQDEKPTAQIETGQNIEKIKPWEIDPHNIDQLINISYQISKVSGNNRAKNYADNHLLKRKANNQPGRLGDKTKIIEYATEEGLLQEAPDEYQKDIAGNFASKLKEENGQLLTIDTQGNNFALLNLDENHFYKINGGDLEVWNFDNNNKTIIEWSQQDTDGGPLPDGSYLLTVKGDNGTLEIKSNPDGTVLRKEGTNETYYSDGSQVDQSTYIEKQTEFANNLIKIEDQLKKTNTLLAQSKIRIQSDDLIYFEHNGKQIELKLPKGEDSDFIRNLRSKETPEQMQEFILAKYEEVGTKKLQDLGVTVKNMSTRDTEDLIELAQKNPESVVERAKAINEASQETLALEYQIAELDTDNIGINLSKALVRQLSQKDESIDTDSPEIQAKIAEEIKTSFQSEINEAIDEVIAEANLEIDEVKNSDLNPEEKINKIREIRVKLQTNLLPANLYNNKLKNKTDFQSIKKVAKFNLEGIKKQEIIEKKKELRERFKSLTKAEDHYSKILESVLTVNGEKIYSFGMQRRLKPFLESSDQIQSINDKYAKLEEIFNADSLAEAQLSETELILQEYEKLVNDLSNPEGDLIVSIKSDPELQGKIEDRVKQTAEFKSKNIKPYENSRGEFIGKIDYTFEGEQYEGVIITEEELDDLRYHKKSLADFNSVMVAKNDKDKSGTGIIIY